VTTGPPPPRAGRTREEGPFDGVPDHLGAPLTHWLRGQLIDPAPFIDFWHTGPRVNIALIHRATLAGRIPLPGHPEPMNELNHLLKWWQQDPERFLDFIHYLLQEIDVDEDDVGALDRILERGGSVWRSTDWGLERRVDPVATAAFEMATGPEDTASAELDEAWTKAYGRDPDPSDAWDHAIKAVEAVLIDVVVPKKAKANLSDVIGNLRAQGHLWKLEVRGQKRDHGVDPLVHMLTLIWPDPNRHGSATPEAPATIEEARAVVHLAVTIVQWGRDGVLVRK
jgi:hypothetical protein